MGWAGSPDQTSSIWWKFLLIDWGWGETKEGGARDTSVQLARLLLPPDSAELTAGFCKLADAKPTGDNTQ